MAMITYMSLRGADIHVGASWRVIQDIFSEDSLCPTLVGEPESYGVHIMNISNILYIP